MKRGLIYLFILVQINLSAAVTNSITDSLENRLSNTHDKNEKASLLNSLAYEYRKLDPNKALEHATKALSISQASGNKNEQINALLLMGVIHKHMGEIDMAIENNLKSLALAEEAGDSSKISACYNNLGNIYQIQEQFNKAIDYYTKSLNIELKTGNKQQSSIRYYNIGAIYEILDSMKLAKDYYTYSLSIERELKNSEGIFYALYGIAGVECHSNNNDAAKDLIEEALSYAFQANDPVGKMLCYSELGNIYFNFQSYTKALEFFEQSLYYAKTINYKNDILDAYNNLYNTYKKLGQMDLALEYLEYSVALNDSILNIESNNKIAELEAKFESEKKEQTIEAQDFIIQNEKAVNEQKNTEQLFLIIGLGLMGLLAFFIFRNYRVKNKANTILSDKNRQIMYSLEYAKKIQNAILPTEKLVKKSFKNSFVLYDPKDIVSGDFYWITCIEKRLILATADCTGHGVPGAFMSMIGNTLLNEIIGKL